MHRIDAADHVGNQFSEGDVFGGRAGTKVDAAWLNAVQEELANAIESVGIALVKGNNAQLAAALAAAVSPGVRTAPDSFANGWASAGGARPLRVRQLGPNLVIFEGVATNPTADYLTIATKTLCVLPVGFRPAAAVTLRVFEFGFTQYVTIGSNGTVTWFGDGHAAGGLVVFEGLMFTLD